MKFKCISGELLSALQIVTRALSVRTTQPILEGVLIETYSGGLRLTGSDGSISIVTSVNAQIEEDGSAVLPGRLLNEVVRKLPEGEVSASLSASFSLSLRCMGSRTNIAGQSAENYPPLPTVSKLSEIRLPQNMLKDMIQRTSFAIATDDSRLVLMGGYLNIQNGEVHIVGLDGYRMALRVERISDCDKAISAIIPEKSLDEIAKLMQEDDEAFVDLVIGGNQLVAEMGVTRVYTRLIEGEYIDYKQVLPKTWLTQVRVRHDALMSCVDRASLMAREGKNNLIKFTVENDTLFITSNSEVGDVHEEVEIATQGNDITIAFNVKYLIEIMRVIDSEYIYLKFNSPVSPCVITPDQGDAFTYLVLPVRINA